MIWILLLISACACAAYLAAPLIKPLAHKPLMIGLLAIFTVGTAGIYALIGSPDLTRKSNVKQAANAPFANLPNGIDPNDITPDDITAMVEGLAARLRENPDDIEGWTRLLRARIVTADIPKLIADHKAMRDAFEDRPDDILQISEVSGFNEFVASVVAQQTEIEQSEIEQSENEQLENEQSSPVQ